MITEPVRAVVFDFDGTVANTFPVIFDAFKEVFRVFKGVVPASEEIVPMFGPTETGTIREQFPEFDDIRPLVECFYERYERRHDELTSPVTHIGRFLTALAARGFRLGLFTGKGRRSLDISLSRLFTGIRFDSIVTGDDIAHPKPDPEGLLKALAMLGAHPRESMYVGDSDSDMRAGKAAGVTTVRAAWFDTGAPQAEDEAGDYRFETFDEFAAFMEGVEAPVDDSGDMEATA